MVACSTVDFGVKISERMFLNVVHIQLNVILHSKFTALEGTCNYCRFPAEAYRCLLVS